MEQFVRVSGYNDYIALDFADAAGKIESTPFYIKEGGVVEVHWMRPSNERCENPTDYDDFNDKYLFKMEGGKLSVRWLNGPCSHMENFTRLEPIELIEWRFEYARFPKQNN